MIHRKLHIPAQGCTPDQTLPLKILVVEIKSKERRLYGSEPVILAITAWVTQKKTYLGGRGEKKAKRNKTGPLPSSDHLSWIPTTHAAGEKQTG